MSEFTKEELLEILEYCNAWESGVGMSDFRINLWNKMQSMFENYCEHEFFLIGCSGHCYAKCSKCGNESQVMRKE